MWNVFLWLTGLCLCEAVLPGLSNYNRSWTNPFLEMTNGFLYPSINKPPEPYPNGRIWKRNYVGLSQIGPYHELNNFEPNDNIQNVHQPWNVDSYYQFKRPFVRKENCINRLNFDYNSKTRRPQIDCDIPKCDGLFRNSPNKDKKEFFASYKCPEPSDICKCDNFKNKNDVKNTLIPVPPNGSMVISPTILIGQKKPGKEFEVGEWILSNKPVSLYVKNDTAGCGPNRCIPCPRHPNRAGFRRNRWNVTKHSWERKHFRQPSPECHCQRYSWRTEIPPERSTDDTILWKIKRITRPNKKHLQNRFDRPSLNHCQKMIKTSKTDSQLSQTPERRDEFLGIPFNPSKLFGDKWKFLREKKVPHKRSNNKVHHKKPMMNVLKNKELRTGKGHAKKRSFVGKGRSIYTEVTVPEKEYDDEYYDDGNEDDIDDDDDDDNADDEEEWDDDNCPGDQDYDNYPDDNDDDDADDLDQDNMLVDVSTIYQNEVKKGPTSEKSRALSSTVKVPTTIQADIPIVNKNMFKSDNSSCKCSCSQSFLVFDNAGHTQCCCECTSDKPYISFMLEPPNKSACESEHCTRCVCSICQLVKDFGDQMKDCPDEKSLLKSLITYSCRSYVPLVKEYSISADMKPRLISKKAKELIQDNRNGPKEITADVFEEFMMRGLPNEGIDFFIFPSTTVEIPCFTKGNVKLSCNMADSAKYKWTHSNKKAITEGRISQDDNHRGTLRIEDVTLADSDNYTCTVCYLDPDSEQLVTKSFVHAVSVVVLPKLALHTNIHYSASVKCDQEVLEMFELYMPQQIDSEICTIENGKKACSVEIHNPLCHIKECQNSLKRSLDPRLLWSANFLKTRWIREVLQDEEPEMEMSLNYELDLHPISTFLLEASNKTRCDPHCQQKLSLKMMEVLRESFLDALLTPVTSSLGAVFKPSVPSINIKLLIACDGGLELRNGFCMPCKRNHFSEEGKTVCLPCPGGTYQSNIASKCCIDCPHPFLPGCFYLGTLRNFVIFFALVMVFLLFVYICFCLIRRKFRKKKYRKCCRFDGMDCDDGRCLRRKAYITRLTSEECCSLERSPRRSKEDRASLPRTLNEPRQTRSACYH